ncbi:MmgE/PrpD family protein [Microvirga sp. 17 mud 1-3]|uniref:MmgE/PrpD family protein n=1 Tax=Microvirga sp. 17 mud 1-3 TaxID=2082949 RepID=UPI000D6BA5F9|nr:MmgE/PrpD family protein [Microvirga sp. 17 mud 1-3]AWM87070.1 2-methylcitrate dehydratase [Microvirga sp. 17 mud 1-3]
MSIQAGASRVAALAQFVASATPSDLPPAIRTKAARHTLDTLACGIAGAASQEAQAALDLLLATEHRGDVAVWGTNEALSARSATLVNGIACHAFELDDTGGCDHSGAVVLPAALAAVAMAGWPVSGKEFLLAVTLGYDIGRRVLEACGGYEPHNEAGWHSTATCGTFGAAAAAARLLKLDSTGIAHALGHAASFSGGLWAFIHDGSQTKRIHAGRAAEGGLLAALLARSGISGPFNIFENVWGGFLATFAAETAQPDALTKGLGEGWRLERVSLKPYASCRGTHSSVDALGVLLDRHNLAREDVEGIEVRLSPFLSDMCGGRDVATLPFAQMSLPYALAARLALGHAGLSAYSEKERNNPSLISAMQRVSLIVDPSIGADEEPFVRVLARDGRADEMRVERALGSPANPVTDEAYFAKIRSLGTMAIDGSGVRHLIEGVLGMWEQDDMRWLNDTLQATTRPALFR